MTIRPFVLSALALVGMGKQAVAAVTADDISNFEVAHVTPLAITSDQSRLIAVNTPNASIELFTLNAQGTPRFERAIKVGVDPVTVRLRSDTEAWVINNTSDNISIVDLSSGIVKQTLQACDEPADVVFAGTPNAAYVSCAGSEEVLVYNLQNLNASPTRIPILGEQPRSLAVSRDGREVYVGIFESGNGTTAISAKNNCCETNLVQDASGPYGGVNPPPNRGDSFFPALNPNNPPPSNLTSMIVKRRPDGRWFDDNNGDWTRIVTGGAGSRDRIQGWDLIDRDVAIINTNNHQVRYSGGMLNIVMSMAVHPTSGKITTVGTDATNEVRFEPVINGVFLKVLMGSITSNGATSVQDLNPHLDYSGPRIAQSERNKSIGDPRGIAWMQNGAKALVTGMGSNNVIVIDADGDRQGRQPTIEVGEGPTGVVLAESRNRAYVLNKFDASISTVNLNSEQEVARTAFSIDPTPEVIRVGRPMLYDTHRFSGLGQISCASCHVDGKTDRLAWDLGNPAGEMNTVRGVTHHPMKGPLLTQTLVDTMQSNSLHWRGDRPDLGHFAVAFDNLQGADQSATAAEIAAMDAYLRTLRTPPNPYRNLDNSYPTRVEMRGPNGTILRVGNAVRGAQQFERSCRSCHLGHTGRGKGQHVRPFSGGQALTAPRWQNFYKRDGLWFRDATASTIGFGFQQDGTFDSTHNQTRSNDLMAFMYSFNGSFPYAPAGLDEHSVAIDAHAAVGRQVTLQANRPDTLLSQLETLANEGAIELAAHACIDERITGLLRQANGEYRSDIAGKTYSASFIKSLADAAPVTFTAVRSGTGTVFALDEDGNGTLDGDEGHLKACKTPELIINGNFHAPSLSAGQWRIFDEIPGWTTPSGRMEVWNNLFGYTGPNGQKTMIETDASRTGGTDTIQQTITLAAGKTYVLRFAYAGRPGRSPSQTRFNIRWNGQVITTLAPDGRGQSKPNWQTASLLLTAQTENTLQIQEAGNNGSLGALITGVSLKAAQQVELIENGNFSTPHIRTGGWGHRTDIAGWSNPAGAMEVWNRLNGYHGPDGETFMIETDAARGSQRDEAQQQVTAGVGEPLKVRFAYAGRPGRGTQDTRFELVWNGEVIDTLTPDGRGNSSPQWTIGQYDLTSQGNNTLSFREAGSNSSYGALITGVSVTALR